MNNKTPIDSVLDIHIPMILPDETDAEITINEEERRWIINFDETYHPFSTASKKEGSRSIRWGDPPIAKGAEK